jgi:hypothetical protein
MMNRKYFWLWLLLPTAGPAYGETMPPVAFESRWRDAPIIIDGKDDDWQKRSIAVGAQKMVVDIANDDAHLYLYVHTWDKSLSRAIIFAGFTIWFESPSGGKLGIRFPVGVADDPKFQAVIGNQEKFKAYVKQNGDPMERMEITEPDTGEKVNSTLQYFQHQGIFAALQAPDGGLIYELKLPLVKRPDQPYAVSSSDSKTFRLYFDYPFYKKPESAKMPEQNANGAVNHPRGMRENGMHEGNKAEPPAADEPKRPDTYRELIGPILEADVSLAAPQDKTLSENQNATIKDQNIK